MIVVKIAGAGLRLINSRSWPSHGVTTCSSYCSIHSACATLQSCICDVNVWCSSC